jgi:hypothetical protein
MMRGTLPLNGTDQVAVCIKLHEVVDPAIAVAAALVVGKVVNCLPGVVRYANTPVGHDLFRQARATREIGAGGFSMRKKLFSAADGLFTCVIVCYVPQMTVLLSSMYLAPCLASVCLFSPVSE